MINNTPLCGYKCKNMIECGICLNTCQESDALPKCVNCKQNDKIVCLECITEMKKTAVELKCPFCRSDLVENIQVQTVRRFSVKKFLFKTYFVLYTLLFLSAFIFSIWDCTTIPDNIHLKGWYYVDNIVFMVLITKVLYEFCKNETDQRLFLTLFSMLSILVRYCIEILTSNSLLKRGFMNSFTCSALWAFLIIFIILTGCPIFIWDKNLVNCKYVLFKMYFTLHFITTFAYSVYAGYDTYILLTGEDFPYREWYIVDNFLWMSVCSNILSTYTQSFFGHNRRISNCNYTKYAWIPIILVLTRFATEYYCYAYDKERTFSNTMFGTSMLLLGTCILLYGVFLTIYTFIIGACNCFEEVVVTETSSRSVTV